MKQKMRLTEFIITLYIFVMNANYKQKEINMTMI